MARRGEWGAVKFYCGMHHPHNSHRVLRAFVSVNALRRRKSAFPVNEWIMDSGAFTTLATHGRYLDGPEEYAEQIERWRSVGTMVRAVSQDYMCEPFMLERTGATVREHQRWTIGRYEALEKRCGDTVMPVLQGFEPHEYVRHVRDYRLPSGAYVGVGSVCKRQGRPSAIISVLDAILTERPDLRLHGFGVKWTSLGDAGVRDRLHSADSMAWSFAARRQGRDQNDWREAVRYAERVESMPVQGTLL